MSRFTFAELPAGSDRDASNALYQTFDRREFDRWARLYPRDAKWGFTIYRTVYTSESDNQFLSALEKIKTCFAIALRYELRTNHTIRAYDISLGENPRPLINAGPCDQVEDQYDPLVIEDREICDGASIEDVRAHFRDAIFYEAVESQCISYDPEKEHITPMTHLAQDPKSSICLVIDAEALSWMTNSKVPERGMYCLREEELRAMPNDPMMHLGSSPFKSGQHGRVKGVDADWPRHTDIWETDDNEPSMLGARNGIPDPPRRVSQYQGWRPVECELLWYLYNDELRNGGRLGIEITTSSRRDESITPSESKSNPNSRVCYDSSSKAPF
ncbi:hypothetical protein VE02_03677 [Pseudogymnoascus sp. 03VT05]|nr:hypothetical protein VE02_03677 [Pseudogymnoascus sp. 03VT05]